MYPLRRFLAMTAGSLLADKVDLLDTVTLEMPVRRVDVESSRMNNGRYLTLMDLGRFALIVRAGHATTMVKRRWYPLVTGVMIRFRKSLRVGTRFSLETRLLGWDERSFYLEQRFVQRGETRAHAYVASVFMGAAEGRLPIATVLAAIGHGRPSPPLPEAIGHWMRADASAFG